MVDLEENRRELKKLEEEEKALTVALDAAFESDRDLLQEIEQVKMFASPCKTGYFEKEQLIPIMTDKDLVFQFLNQALVKKALPPINKDELSKIIINHESSFKKSIDRLKMMKLNELRRNGRVNLDQKEIVDGVEKEITDYNSKFSKYALRVPPVLLGRA